jgi:hypothetical protein
MIQQLTFKETLHELCREFGEVTFHDDTTMTIVIAKPQPHRVHVTVIEEMPALTPGTFFHKLVARFATVGAKLQYPKMFLRLADTTQLKLYRAGDRSKFPNSINICLQTPDRMYHNNDWCGRIHTNGRLEFADRALLSEDEKQLIIEAISHFEQRPQRVAEIYGHQTSACCFCGRELLEPSSVELGYGPICAENWGLPHGQHGTWTHEPTAAEFDKVFK